MTPVSGSSVPPSTVPGTGSGAVRTLEARLYTHEFRVYGLIHLPLRQGTAQRLNQNDRPHLAMTSCRVYGGGAAHPPDPAELLYDTDFAAVPKARISWLVGGRPDPSPPQAVLEQRRIYCIYAEHIIVGALKLARRQRLSDFLNMAMTDKPFQTLHQVRVLAAGSRLPLEQRPVLQEHAFVTLNLRTVGGVFDLQGNARPHEVVLEEE